MEKSLRDIEDVLSEAIEKPDMFISEKDRERLERMKAVYARWLENPLLTDTNMRDFIMANYKVGRAMAYQDIALIKAIFGNAPKMDREFQRYRANHLLAKAAAAALAGNDKKAKSLTKIAETLIKANNLDEPEGEEMKWTEIKPKDYSFTVDPTVIGIEKEPGIEDKARKLLKQYTQEIDDQ